MPRRRGTHTPAIIAIRKQRYASNARRKGGNACGIYGREGGRRRVTGERAEANHNNKVVRQQSICRPRTPRQHAGTIVVGVRAFTSRHMIRYTFVGSRRRPNTFSLSITTHQLTVMPPPHNGLFQHWSFVVYAVAALYCDEKEVSKDYTQRLQRNTVILPAVIIYAAARRGVRRAASTRARAG